MAPSAFVLEVPPHILAACPTTLTVLITAFEPFALEAVNFTLLGPVVAKVFEGSCAVESVDPLFSKSQAQEVGTRVDMSVKFTACPAMAIVGALKKSATGGPVVKSALQLAANPGLTPPLSVVNTTYMAPAVAVIEDWILV